MVKTNKNHASSFKPKYLYTHVIPKLQHKMNFTKLFSLFALIALAVLSVGFASAATIFSDGFESGTVGSAPTGWTVTNSPNAPVSPQTPWSVVSTNTGSGLRSIETMPGSPNTITSTLEIPVSTSGFQTIVFEYGRQLGETSGGSFEAADEFKASWSSDGTSFLPLETINAQSTDANYVSKLFNLPTSANNNANLRIRFECKTNAQNEFCRLDTVNITGTVIAPSSNITITVPSSPVQAGQNASITINNVGTSTLMNIVLSELSSFNAVFNPPQIASLANGASSPVQVAVNTLSNLRFGTNTVQVRAQASNGQIGTGNVQFKKTFCSSGPVVANLSISNVDWNNEGEGDDDSWELLDEIEVEVEVRNSNNDDEIDAIVKLGLFDSNGQNNADDLIYLSDSDGTDEEIEITVDEDDEETVTYRFKVPADLDEGSYKLALKVYDDDEGENSDCDDSTSDFNNDFFQSIDIEQTSDDERFVIVDEIETNTPLACGESLTGQFTVFNVGQDDQERIRITMKNTALGIDEEFEIIEDLDQGEDKTLDFSVPTPLGAENKYHTIVFRTFYDYKNGVYREESEQEFVAPVEITGCTGNLGNSGNGLTNTQISAELDSEAIAGETLVVLATIRNTGDSEVDYSVDARDFDDWASLDEISDESFSLDAGEEKEITMTFTVNDDAEGVQTFDIQVASGGRVQIQEVEVELESAQKGFEFNFGDSSAIWIIGLVNLVLIVLIIIVAVKLSKR